MDSATQWANFVLPLSEAALQFHSTLDKGRSGNSFLQTFTQIDSVIPTNALHLDTEEEINMGAGLSLSTQYGMFWGQE